MIGNVSVKPKDIDKYLVPTVEPCSTRDDYLSQFSETDAACINEGTMLFGDTNDNIQFTAYLRLAAAVDDDGELLFPHITEHVKDVMGYRGLPVKLRLSDSFISLRPHQVQAIKHIERVENCQHLHNVNGSIIRMEMGMGKTLMAISWCLMAPRPPRDDRYGYKGYPCLIVASKTVMIEWKQQGFEKFFDDRVSVLYFHKEYMDKEEYESITMDKIVEYDFVVTTYDVIKTTARKFQKELEDVLVIGESNTLQSGKIVDVSTRKYEQLNKKVKGVRLILNVPWERVVADESHCFANPTTAVFKSMMTIYGRYKLCLTGTPMRNYDTDVWSQLKWCGYTGTTKTEWKSSGIYYMKEHDLNNVIYSISIEDSTIQLPPKTIIDKVNEFEGNEKKAYEFTLGVIRDVYDEMLSAMIGFMSVLALFTRLRQLCIAPYLITAQSKRGNKEEDIETMGKLNKLYVGELSKWIHDRDGTAGIRSCKMTIILDILRSIPKDEKVLVFSTFTSCLDLLKYGVKQLVDGFNVEQIDGDTPTEDRQIILNAFRIDPEIRGLFMTYKVGSEGLNITAANHVICIEPWWTSSVPKQAIARCWRPGQTKEVKVYNIYVKNTIEERVVEVCNKKNIMIGEYLDGKRGGDGGMNKEMLKSIIG